MKSTRPLKEVHRQMLVMYSPQTVVDYLKWGQSLIPAKSCTAVEKSAATASEINTSTLARNLKEDFRGSDDEAIHSSASSGRASSDVPLLKAPLYPRLGKRKRQQKPLTIKKGQSYLAQLNEVCHRMIWLAPFFGLKDAILRDGAPHYQAVVMVCDHNNSLMAHVEDTKGASTRAATREAAARLALESLLD